MNSHMMMDMLAARAAPRHSIGEQAFGEPLVAADFSAGEDTDFGCRMAYGVQQKLSTLATHPELTIRPVDLRARAPERVDAEHMADFTAELWFLEECGLHVPGISMAREPRLDGAGVLEFVVTDRIDGLRFDEELPLIPEQVAVNACRSIMRYHGAIPDRGPGLFAWDVSAKQLVYDPYRTTLPRDAASFVDFDPNYMVLERGVRDERFGALRFAALHNIEASITLLERAYGRPFDELRAEQEAVEARLEVAPEAAAYMAEEVAMAA